MTLNTQKINSNERFIRWQGILREHVTFINNLLMTIAIAVVGYLISLLNEVTFNPIDNKKILFTTGLTLTFISICLGLATTISRLLDFKATLKKIKIELEKKSSDELELLKTWMQVYGKTTWRFLYWQMGTFSAGILILIIAFGDIYSDKLF